MVLFIYAVLINGYGFWIMGADKKRAKARRWRISEKRIWLTAAMFGSLGVWIGMRAFRHKTKHKSFLYGVPILFLAEAALVLIYLMYKK
ncbi:MULTISPECIES: DUF1294 domain-containing protein [Bacillus]|uniref:DUF1294 domain-containing protein n=1 Tax=Bacillus TaxID=1386 RepID=UPI00077920AA|nr:DUF1294 domain-containing protein [Bacillus amyloliquefaciens]KYC93441.1 hypothetical protein B425_2874 [Bacillus amyloliquefaciens]MBW8280100.1 DUF1294 domain-containing protein [Bacillus amyloliquefaciens]MEC1249692.1 DUF1294 domain-containing protein [Bacillus amyloliquefaciens]MEC2251640.1 DUF1294 domain-containing protein [Bacillus amyloliquefaciens]MED0754119.1 DUF1294 domain-containing protein [Bacillus amyloliquefaciens]